MAEWASNNQPLLGLQVKRENIYTRSETGSSDAISSNDEDDNLKKLRRNKLAFMYAIMASMISGLLGYDTGVMSGAVIYIKDEFRITDVQVELLVGLLNIYSILGSIVAGRTSDWIGRRYTIVIGAAHLFVGSLLMGVSTNFTFLMIGRFFAGVGVGYACTIASVYTAELVDPLSDPSQRVPKS